MNLKLIFLLTATLTWGVLSGCNKELEITVPGALVPKTVDQNPALPSISVNGALLHSEAFGDPSNPMIVVLHGGPGVDYRSVLNCSRFAEDGYYVVFYDQRGSGLSERFNKDIYSIQLMLDDLTGVINYYRTSPNQKVFLLGHSWGAMLATAYVNSYPTVINGLILAEPGGFTWEDAKAYIERSRSLNPTSELANDVTYQDQFITGKESEQEVLDYKMQLQAASDFEEGNTNGNAGPYPFWRMGAVVSQALFDIANRDGFDFTTNLTNYTTKVLFVYSELNKAYGLDHAQKVSSAYPDVQLERIDGSGHEMIYFGWNNFYPVTLQYLQTLK